MKTDKNDLGLPTYLQSKSLKVKNPFYKDRNTGKHTNKHSWKVTQGQSCELCPTVTMAMRDLQYPKGGSCAVQPPKAKDVPMNPVVIVYPNPSLLSISRCHLSSLSLSFLFSLFNFLCPGSF